MKNLAFVFILFFIKTAYSQTFTIPNQNILNQDIEFIEINEINDFAFLGGFNLYKSSDQGVSFSQITETGISIGDRFTKGTAVDDQTFFIIGKNYNSTEQRVYFSNSNGNQWITCLNLISSPIQLIDIKVNNSTVIVTATNGIYASYNQGANWQYLPITPGITPSFIYYDQTTSTWILPGVGNFFKTSIDNGQTWQDVPTTLTPSQFTDLKKHTNNYLFTGINSNNNSTFTRTDLSLSVLSESTHPIESYSYDGYNANNSAILPNGKYITHDHDHFFLINPNTGEINFFQFNFNQVYPIINDMDFNSNYGIAVGSQGSLCRIGLTGESPKFVKAYFEIIQEPICNGDTIILQDTTYFADSVQWFINDELVGTDGTLIYANTSTNQFIVNFTVWKDGVSRFKEYTYNTLFTVPLSQPTLFVQQPICYNTSKLLEISGLPIGGSQNIKIYMQGQEIFNDVTPISGNNMSFMLPQLTQDEMLTIISSKQSYCDTFIDTSYYFIDVYDEIINFQKTDFGNHLCHLDSVSYQITNLIPGATYQFDETDFNNPSSLYFSYPVTATNASDTISYHFPPVQSNQGFISTQGITNAYWLKISAPNGCVYQTTLDTIHFQNTFTKINATSQTYLVNDTLLLQNQLPSESQNWSFNDLNDHFYISNSADINPKIAVDTAGVFQLKLINFNPPSCSDSNQRYFVIANQFVEDTTEACAQLKTGIFTNLIEDTKQDPFGNTFISGRRYTTYGNLTYYLSKYDQQKNLIWEKKSNQNLQGGYNTSSIVDDFEFDQEGNIYTGIYVVNGGLYYEDDFVLQDEVLNQLRTLIVKIDGQTGDVLWNKNIFVDSIIPFINQFNQNYFRLTDIIVHDNKITVSILHDNNSFGYNLIMFSLDLDGNYIQGSYHFLSLGYYFSMKKLYNNPAHEIHRYYLSPILKKKRNGDIIGIANYKTNEGYDNPLLINTPTVEAWMIFEYNEEDGIHIIKKLATTSKYDNITLSANDGFNLYTNYDLDEEDNLYLAFDFKNADSILFSDSILPTELIDGTAIAKFNNDYQLEWVNIGTSTKIQDLYFAKKSNEVVIMGKSPSLFSIQDQSGTFHALGREKVFDSLNYPFDDYWFDYGNLNLYKNLYVSTFSDAGNLVKSNTIDIKNLSNPSATIYGLTSIQKMNVSPCSDYSLLISNRTNLNYQLTDDQINYSLNNTGIWLDYAENCSMNDDCSYLSTINSFRNCSYDSILKIEILQKRFIDEVDYQLIQNNQLIQVGTVETTGQYLEIALPSTISGNFQIILATDIYDTLHGIRSNLTQVDFSYDSLICVNEQTTIVPLNSEYNYFWNDTTLINNGLDISYQELISLNTNQFVIKTEDTLGCFITDTLFLSLLPNIPLLNNDSFQIACQDSLIVQFDSTLFSNINWYVNMIQTENLFNSTNCLNGLNNAVVQYEDNNGCLSVQDFTINYCFDLSIENIKNEKNIILSPNPNDGSFNLSIPNDEITSCLIESIDGKIIQETEFIGAKTYKINLNVVSGNYLIHFYTKKAKIETLKFTIL